MLGRRLLWRSGSTLTCALFALACDAYDPSLLRFENPNKPPVQDSGKPLPEDDAGGGGEDSGTPMCVKSEEICNGRDDDCDGKIDESTQAYCESVIVNAETTCVPTAGKCVKIACHDGFWDCDGKPQNGCEKPFCDCNDCADAGSERDGGS